MFSLLEGTNRNKGAEEIRAVSLSKDQLKDEIARLAAGESLYWLDSSRVADGSQNPFSLPPADVVSELKDYAAALDVTIYTITLTP